MPSVDNMNERIKQLIDQSITGTSPQWLSRSNAEKLAELIVKECINALDENDGSLHHSEYLLEHFGVEE
jgi:hypothetical protein